MSRRSGAFLAFAAIAVAVGAALPARAKTLCGAIAPPSPFPFYVIEKVKTKIGAHGAVSGYFIDEDASDVAPFSGNYAVFSEQWVYVSATWGVGQGGFGYATRLVNFSAPTEGSSPGQGYQTVVDGANANVVDGGTFETTWVDCKTVPKFPVAAP